MEYPCKNCNNGKALVCKPTCQKIFKGQLHAHRCFTCKRAGKYTRVKEIIFKIKSLFI